MFDAKELLERLQAGGGDPKAREALGRLQNAMQSAEGQRLAKSISRETAAGIERATRAAQAGDKRAAQDAVRELLKTPEGAALAAQLQRLLGR